MSCDFKLIVLICLIINCQFLNSQPIPMVDSPSHFLYKLNNQIYQSERAAKELIRTNQTALLEKDNAFKQQLLTAESFLRMQQENEKQLFLQNNLINKQELEKKEYFKMQADKEMALLNQDIAVKKKQFRQQATIKNLALGVLLFFLIACMTIIRSLFLKRKNDKLSREVAEKSLIMQQLEIEKHASAFQQQTTELEMQALRAQMNPHFIFNCLSSINKYIIKNQADAASDYLTRFSRLIRMVLINSEKSMISLEDELDMLRLYLDMERLRFKNCFDYDIILTNNIDMANIFIPPLLLQPFCENAIWHGLMHKEGQGKLNIRLGIENDFLACTLSDNGVGREKAAAYKSMTGEKQKSLGLKITNDRLALFNVQKQSDSYYEMSDLYNEDGSVDGTEVKIFIKHKPLIEEKLLVQTL